MIVIQVPNKKGDLDRKYLMLNLWNDFRKVVKFIDVMCADKDRVNHLYDYPNL